MIQKAMKGKIENVNIVRNLLKIEEYHFILICKEYDDLLRQYLQSKYFVSPNVHKWPYSFVIKNELVISYVAIYLYHANIRRSNL